MVMTQFKNKDELLDETLENLFKHMKNLGIEISDQVKNTIKTDMKKDLSESLDLDDLKDKDVQKKLLGCITAKILGNTEQYKKLTGELNSHDPKIKQQPSPGLDEKLAIDGVLIKALSTMLEKKKNGKELSLEDAVSNILKHKEGPEPKNKNEKSKDELKKEDDSLTQNLKACLRNLNGGDDPTVDGEVPFPIIGPIFGNLSGFVNQCTADANSVSFMKQAITYNAGKSDPYGLENALKLSEVSDGIAPTSTKSPANTME
jgi:hypothetical protein